MATFIRSQKLLVSTGVAALGGGFGGAALLLAGNIVTTADAGATAADTSPLLVGPDAAVCRTPAATGSPYVMFRLAQTEVPRADDERRHLGAGVRGQLSRRYGAGSAPSLTRSPPRTSARRPISIRACGSLTRSITTRRSARSAWRRSSIPNAPCASGARRWCSVPTSICRCRRTRWRRRYAAAQKAKALAAKASPREQALIGALAVRYGSDPKAARAPFDAAYAAEMAKVGQAVSRTTTRSPRSMPRR